MVYIPAEKTLIAGDILVNGVVPTMQDGIVKNRSEPMSSAAIETAPTWK